MTNFRLLQRLRKELDVPAKKEKTSSPVSALATEALPYLQAVILGALCIHPPFTELVMNRFRLEAVISFKIRKSWNYSGSQPVDAAAEQEHLR